MNKTILEDSLKLSPFRPFTIQLVDRQEFQIDDPNFVLLSPSREVVIFFIDEHYYVIDTDKISSITNVSKEKVEGCNME